MRYCIIFIAEDDGYTFLQMRSMYCFVEYKMLLFNPTLQETIGDDIIYIISKPPEDSASDHTVPQQNLIGGYYYVYVQTQGWSILAIPFFCSKRKRKETITQVDSRAPH